MGDREQRKCDSKNVYCMKEKFKIYRRSMVELQKVLIF